MSSKTATTQQRAADPLWSGAQVAEYLGVSPGTVKRIRYRGELPTVMVGGAVRIPRSAVLGYVTAQTMVVEA